MLVEQFHNSIGNNLRVYLAEREVAELQEAARLADNYVLIHGDMKERSRGTFLFGQRRQGADRTSRKSGEPLPPEIGTQ